MRLLLVSTDLQHMGGVVETVKLFMREFEGKVDVTHAAFGRRVNQKGIMRIFRTLADLFCFARLLSGNRFDIIHMNPSMNLVSVLKEAALFFVFYLFGYSGKVLIFIHGWDDVFFKRLASGRITAVLLRTVFNRAGLITVLADDFKKELIRSKVDASKVEVVSTMVDMAKVPASSACKGDGKSLLFLSRMIVGKGVYELLDGYALLSERYSGLKLVMAGDGPELEALKMRAADLGLKDISFPGYIQDEDKFMVLQENCIYLLPTSREGCPVSLLEAMASGMASVVTGAGGIKDFIQPGKTAILLEEVSAEAIAESVGILIDNPDLRISVAENARNYATEHFASGKVAERILEFYSRLVPGK
ncbi:glycosyltransferase family 4 protein [Maridesulfovibrio sp.]|uniref:glycosyltransferase family 4 protein n=1 Tax=Maridesulfovibrio sp. TaxID=2795000 RepID=UPI0039F09DD3